MDIFTKNETINQFDKRLTSWMDSNGLPYLRISIGIVFFWFGAVKFFEGMSPAEEFATKTINTLTFNLFADEVTRYGLATWETLIGLGLLLNVYIRITLLLLFLQMIGTFTPLFLFTDELFHIFPFSLTMEGQYIVKNIVIVSAALVIGARVRREGQGISDRGSN